MASCLLSNFFVLEDDDFACLVTSTVQICKNLQRFFLSNYLLETKNMQAKDDLPATIHQITGTLREDKHSKTENDGGNHLQAPWNTEGGNAIDV